MEEFDSILISQLREIGCDFFDDDTDGIGSLDSDQLIKCIAICLHRISSDRNDSIMDLPEIGMIQPTMNMSVKYKIAQQLSIGVKNAGYKSDMDFSTILYSNVPEIRRLLLWLVEQIATERDDKPLGTESSSTNDNILYKLKNYPINTVWLPIYDDDRPITDINDSIIHRKSNLNYSIKSDDGSLLKHHVYNCDLEIFPKNLIDILEWNNNYYCWKNYRDNNSDPLESYLIKQKKISLINRTDDSRNPFEKTETILVENQNEIIENEINGTEIDNQEKFLENLRKQLKEYEEQIEELKLKDKELIEKEKEYQEKYKKLEASYKTKKELENGIETVKVSIQEISQTWEKVQEELIKKLKEKTREHTEKNFKQMEKLKKINNLKKSIQTKLKEIQAKESMIIELESKIPQQWPPGRGSYTRRIMEIIQNVKKQDDETMKVVKETKIIQKDINNLNGKIERSFTVAEDVLFREAKQNEWNRKCYKCLASLQLSFEELLLAINDIGLTLREIRKLEELIEIEKNKKTGSKLARINADLEQIRLENKQLRKKIQQQ